MRGSPRPWRFLRDAGWLTPDRLVAYGGAAFLAQAALLGGAVLWAAGRFGAPLPVPADFVSFYGAGRLALSGAPHLAYDHAALWQAEQAATSAAQRFNYFLYPPPFLLLCALFAVLPYLPAFLAFEAASLALFLGVMRRVGRFAGWAWLLPVLAFPPVFWTLGLGQNAFLTAALFAAALLLVDRRPLAAGALFGLLAYKPHVGLLVPVALACGGHWRAFAAAAFSALLALALSALVLGAETWTAFHGAFAAAGAIYRDGRVMFAGYVTPFGATRLLGGSQGAAAAIQLVVSGLSAVFVGTLWRRAAPLPVRAAALLAGTLLSVPVLLIYDLTLLLPALLFLGRLRRETGWRPWDLAGFATIYALAFASVLVGLLHAVPLAPLCPLLVLLLCAREMGSRVPVGARPVLAGV